MTDKEYQQKKRECWEAYIAKHGLEYAIPEEAFIFAFDHAYSLGKQTETISQEDVEKAAEEYAEPTRTWASGAETQEIKDAFKAGAQFALGKKIGNPDFSDADTVIQGWVARDEVAIRPALYTSKPLRQKKGFENGYWSYGMQIGLSLDPSLFPDLTWSDEPQECEIIIKRKKK